MLKLKGWELAFEKIIKNLREHELKIVRKSNILISLINFNFGLAIYLVTIASFSSFVFSSQTNVLDPHTAFVCLYLFNMIRMPLRLFGIAFTYFIQVNGYYLVDFVMRQYVIFLRAYR